MYVKMNGIKYSAHQLRWPYVTSRVNGGEGYSRAFRGTKYWGTGGVKIPSNWQSSQSHVASALTLDFIYNEAPCAFVSYSLLIHNSFVYERNKDKGHCVKFNN